jgi:hypothetical protein
MFLLLIGALFTWLQRCNISKFFTYFQEFKKLCCSIKELVGSFEIIFKFLVFGRQKLTDLFLLDRSKERRVPRLRLKANPKDYKPNM